MLHLWLHAWCEAEATGRGTDLWRHDKVSVFGIPRGEAVELEACRPGTLGALGIDEGGGREDVGPGRELVIRDAACGRARPPR